MSDKHSKELAREVWLRHVAELWGFDYATTKLLDKFINQRKS